MAFMNQARQHVIDELNRYQTTSLDRKAHLSQSDRLLEEYQEMGSRVEKFAERKHRNEYEREAEYESIAHKMWRLETEIKRFLLGDRTFYYFKSRPTELGVLFVLEDFYLNEDELGCLNL